MPPISLQSQLTQIFRLLCYRSSGVLLTPTVVPDWANLTYKVTIPLYSHYQKDNFMFADRDTTPKSLAFDMQVHLPRLVHLELEVDQFGNFLVQPTLAYLRKLKEEIVNRGAFTHVLTDEYRSLVTSTPEHICMLYNCSGLGGTEYRMHQFLDSILLKHTLIQTNRISVVNWLPQQLSRQSLSCLIIRKQMEHAFPQPILPSRTISSHLHKLHQGVYSHIWECLKRNHFTKVYVACERHQVVEYEQIFSGYPLQLLTFGGVDPRLNREDTLTMSMKVGKDIPLGLVNPSNWEDTASMGEMETLLALSDHLGADHIDVAYRMAGGLRKQIQSLPETLRLGVAAVDKIACHSAELWKARSVSKYI